MTMGVDYTRQENALAEIQDFIVVRGKLRKFPYLTDASASDPHPRRLQSARRPL